MALNEEPRDKHVWIDIEHFQHIFLHGGEVSHNFPLQSATINAIITTSSTQVESEYKQFNQRQHNFSNSYQNMQTYYGTLYSKSSLLTFMWYVLCCREVNLMNIKRISA